MQHNGAQAMIELLHIYKEIRNDGLVVKILQDVSLSVTGGEFVAIMGPSGSGKSTLMNIIGFLDTATSGNYRFKGTDVSTLTEDELAKYRSSEVGYVFQAFHLLAKTSVLENVKLPLMYHAERRSDQERTTMAKKVIEQVGLGHRLEHLSNQLSGGEKQRVAIARALINNPSLILADEPTGNLDSASGIQIMQILQDLNRQGKTIILVTHESSTAEHARRVVTIRDGAIESDQQVTSQRRAVEETNLK
ncbi:MAG: ABC transporter ATP-binding protein [Candidatus Komeilibacteria bacterium]|nr:ABC transporter ATP-binding protein [Candidatus Komeilibacteria bacterium]